MIRHIVLFKFKEEAGGKTRAENVAATRAMLDGLPAKIDLILESRTFVGTNGINDTNADLILVSDFESPEALAAYIDHPDHRAVGAFMGPLRESRMAIDLTL